MQAIYKPAGKAADTKSRLQALEKFKNYGIRTWVSFEPVIKGTDTLFLLSLVLQYKLVDHVKIGACSGNYSEVNDWKRFGEMAEAICQEFGVLYYLKEDLRERMGRK